MSTAATDLPPSEGPSAGEVVKTSSFENFEQTPATKTNGTADEGVEVVLDVQGGPDHVVDNATSPPRPTPDQNVFRGGRHSSHARSGYPSGPPPPPYGQSSGSFGAGYGRHDYPPRPYPVPPYNPSGSFEEGGSYHNRPPSHYSPHVQYPPAGSRYPGDDVNVISPNHKSSDPKYRSTSSHRRPPPPHYYHYPPTSPVSRGGGQTASPPRLRNFAVHRTIDGPYSKAQRNADKGRHSDGTWNPYPTPSRTASGDRPQPPLVAESSFDSDHFSSSHYSAHPPTPGSGAPHHDAAQSFYGPGGSWANSFDSTPHHPHSSYDDYMRHPPRTPSSHHYPEPPYSPYSHHSHHSSGYHSHHSHYSPGGYYPDQYGSYSGYPPRSYEDEERGMLKDYHPDRDGADKKSGASKSATGIVLPDAAHEVDFEVTDPPSEPVCPPSEEPVVESLAEVNTYDVLCGRGGGTNSQIGNKRFRKLVQEFQPTYLLARRKEKPLLARTIVLIIRKRGGRFLRKDEETGMLYEVGDTKAEAKTSQALREGLDVRATKSAANALSDKKKKKKKGAAAKAKEEKEANASPSAEAEEATKSNPGTPEEKPEQVKSPERTPEPMASSPSKEKQPSPVSSPAKNSPDSPPSLPKLADEEVKAGMVHPHSPEAMQFRKRRRMRALACGADKFFPDFCPPRADLGRGTSPMENDIVDEGSAMIQHSPMRRTSSIDDDEAPKAEAPGCTAAALEMVTGAVSRGLCFGPTKI